MTQTKEDAFALFELHRADWLARARAVAMALYSQKKRPISIDEVRALCPPHPGHDPRIMGAVFAGKQWQAVGWGVSRKTSHHRPIRYFQPA